MTSDKDSNAADYSNNLEAKPEESTPVSTRKKKPFVEPSISLPVDVLEATAFFQPTTVTTSGV